MDLADAIAEIAPLDEELDEVTRDRRQQAAVLVMETLRNVALGVFGSGKDNWSAALPSDAWEEGADVVFVRLLARGPRPGLDFLMEDPKRRKHGARKYLRVAVENQLRTRIRRLEMEEGRPKAPKPKKKGEPAPEPTARPTQERNTPVPVSELAVTRSAWPDGADLDQALARFDECVAGVDSRSRQSTGRETVAWLRRIHAGELTVEEVLEECQIKRAAFDKRNSRMFARLREYIREHARTPEEENALNFLLAELRLR